MAPATLALSLISLISFANALPAAAPGEEASAFANVPRQPATPTAIPEASALVSSAYSAFPSNPISYATELLLNGLVDGADLAAFLEANLSEDNSPNNNNPINPTPAIYPLAGPSDPPYVQTESTLRSAIHASAAILYRFENYLHYI